MLLSCRPGDMHVTVKTSSPTRGTVSWQQLDNDIEVCITLRDVTEIRFPNETGHVVYVPDRLVTPGHVYGVTVRGVTTGTQLEAQHDLPTGK